MDTHGKHVQTVLLRIYQLFILALSLWVLVQLAIEILVELSQEARQALSIVDLSICVVFLVDWIVFLVLAPDKLKYIKSRFLDLAASIPFVSFLRPLRILRVVRIFRAFRLLRGLRGVSTIIKSIAGNPARSAFAIYLCATSLIYFYCSLGMYYFEKGLNPNIGTFGDVLWMAFTTMTTVGYGDIYPATGGGRLISAVLVLTGMGLFSLLTAEIAAFLLKRTRKQEQKEQPKGTAEQFSP